MKKREFLKTGILGCAGLYCGLPKVSGIHNGPSAHSPVFSSDEPWKWSKEASYYVVTPRGARCTLCPNDCTLKEGETGDCRNRIVVDGKLYTIAYGNPCAVHIDPVEKKPLYHFLPTSKALSVATAGCNMACLNCQNWSISQSSPKETRNYDLMPDALVKKALDNKCSSIAYTYGEPVVFYEYMIDSAKIAHKKGIRNIMVSNGYINEKPLRELSRYIDAVNIDLKSFSNSIYLKLNAGELQPVLDTLLTLKEEKVWIEITNLVIPGWTDDFDMIKKMCTWIYNNDLHNYPLHFSRFHPQYKLTRLPATPVSTLIKAREIALEAGLKYVYIGNVPGTGAENTYCPKCGKIVIERKGFKVLKTNLSDTNCCAHCGEPIAGVWE